MSVFLEDSKCFACQKNHTVFFFLFSFLFSVSLCKQMCTGYLHLAVFNVQFKTRQQRNIVKPALINTSGCRTLLISENVQFERVVDTDPTLNILTKIHVGKGMQVGLICQLHPLASTCKTRKGNLWCWAVEQCDSALRCDFIASPCGGIHVALPNLLTRWH